MTARICGILGGRGARSRAGRSPTSPCPPPNLFISLNGGRELRSLAYAPLRRAARARARLPTRHSARGAVAVLLRTRRLEGRRPPYPPPNLIISLNAGRELRSLGYAPLRRAAQSRRPGLTARSPHGRRSSSVAGRANPRTMVRWRAGAAAGQHRVMQNETPKTTTAATFGRSSIARLPPELREAVDAAIADGATIDEIADLIRGEGGACSRSAVGRYTKNVRDLIRQQQETDRGIEMWVRALGERRRGPGGAHPDRDPAVADARRPGRSQRARGARVDGRARPPGAGSQAHRGHRQAPPPAGARRRRKAAKAAPGAGQAPGQAPPRKGLSPETVDLIDEAVVGFRFRPRPPVTSAPVDPWNPAESRESHLIPLNPGESRPENVSEASSSISLNGGRSLRSLAYAPFGAARSRALRTCGPAAVRNSPPKARGAPCHVMAGPARTGSGYPAVHSGRAPVKRLAAGRCPEQVRA